MLPLWPFLVGGRAGDFSRGFIFEGSPRTSRRHERAGGRWSFRDFAREREEDDDVFGAAKRSKLLGIGDPDAILIELRREQAAKPNTGNPIGFRAAS